MNPTTVLRSVHKDDDLAEYVGQYSPEERDELRVASLAHDIVFLRELARRETRGRVVVTIAVPWYDLGVERLTRYLTALGERVHVTEQQLETGRCLQIAPIRRQSTEAHLSAASD